MMFAPRYTVWHCGTLKKGRREMSNFYCGQCGAAWIDESWCGYKAGCPHTMEEAMYTKVDHAEHLRQQLKDCSAVVDRQQKMLDRNTDQIASKQAQIDRLMMEYCPEEMTEEQIARWRKHQVVKKEEK